MEWLQHPPDIYSEGVQEANLDQANTPDVLSSQQGESSITSTTTPVKSKDNSTPADVADTPTDGGTSRKRKVVPKFAEYLNNMTEKRSKRK